MNAKLKRGDIIALVRDMAASQRYLATLPDNELYSGEMNYAAQCFDALCVKIENMAPMEITEAQAYEALRTAQLHEQMTCKYAAPEFSKYNVRQWMRANANTHRDRKTNEINATSLAESCAAAFSMNDEGGPLDDSDHWIWELALEVE